jgi:hypothetical protein
MEWNGAGPGMALHSKDRIARTGRDGFGRNGCIVYPGFEPVGTASYAVAISRRY